MLHDQLLRTTLSAMGFPCGSVVRNPTAIAGDAGSVPGWGRSPGEGDGSPLQYSLPGEYYGQRNLAGHSPCLALGGDTQVLYFPYNDHNLLLVTVGIFHKKGEK